MSTSGDSAARKRIEAVLDENSFVEVGALVKARATDFNLKNNETPSDGVVTGYGLIDGRLVYIYSQDSSVLGGSVGEMHAGKIARIYEMAIKMGAPVIGLIDSAGLRLQESVDGLDAFGKIFDCQVAASGVIPQISAIFGKCGGGLGIVSNLSDFTFMEDDAKLFVNAPNAIDENRKEILDTSGIKYQSEECGSVDFSGSESEVLDGIRSLLSVLPSNNGEEADDMPCEDDLNRVVDEAAVKCGDPAVALSEISDDGFIIETKKSYAPEMLTAFIKLNGATVGVVANRKLLYDTEGDSTELEAGLTSKGCGKAAAFVDFCDAFNIPVLTLTDVKGFSTTIENEKSGAKEYAKLIAAFSDATVPKVNVIVGNAVGSAYIAMNSKSIGADYTFAYPDSKIGMMDSLSAAKIIYSSEIENGTADMALKAAEYDNLQNSIESAAGRGYVDSIISPVDTRKYLIGAFEMLYSKYDECFEKKHKTV